MTAFFIPGIAGDAPDIERACGEIRRQIELDLGRCPISRRILSLWTRRGTVDCITQVGSHDPVRGGTVVAIFDMGPHEPFVVWCETSCLSLVWAVLDLFFSHASNGAAFTEIDRQREGPDRRVS